MTRETNVNPQVIVYPKCSRCDTAYVLRHCLSVGTGRWGWNWYRDCKCRNAECVTARDDPSQDVAR